MRIMFDRSFALGVGTIGFCVWTSNSKTIVELREVGIGFMNS